MRPNRVKQLWRDGKPAVGGWLSMPGCFVAECMASTNLDWMCVDLQHGCIDYSDAVPMLTAISTTNVMPFMPPRATLSVMTAPTSTTPTQ